MSAPPAPTWSPPPPSGAAISSEPDSPSSDDGSSSPSVPGSSSISSSSTPTPTPPARGIGGGGASAPPPTTPPGCAACKHKRQKCTPGCVLAPYFPATDDPDKFRSVLRVFGVKNLLRTLQEVPRPRWDACVRSVVYESRLRVADPVRGCAGAVEDLEAQLVDTAVELEVLRRRLEAHRLAKQSRGLRFVLRPPNPGHHGAAAAASSPRGVLTDLEDAARQEPKRARSDVTRQPQGPYGAASWPPPMGGIAATPPQSYVIQPQPQGPCGAAWATGMAELAATPPQSYAMQPQPQGPYGAAWPPAMGGLAAMPPQLPAVQQQPPMRRQTAATRGTTAMILDDDFGDAWADGDERG